MPVCNFCGVQEATVNLRRRRPPHTGEWMCHDRPQCLNRQQDRREREQRERRSQAQALADAAIAQHDDDPNPYHGTYSEE